jgi:ArsR family transcriptional regulator, nickel/cobalt-responsive transcriptional repressor
MRDRLHSAECSRYLKAVADPDRLKIIQCLQNGPKSVGQISRTLGAAIANISHHLGSLRSAGLVTSEKRGRFVLYTLAPDILRHSSRSTLNILDFGCCRLELGRA